jgi:hypothetical protein
MLILIHAASPRSLCGIEMGCASCVPLAKSGIIEVRHSSESKRTFGVKDFSLANPHVDCG